MGNCVCGGCSCGEGFQITVNTSDAPTEEIQFESHDMNNGLWKTPTVFPNTDGNING
jgi:hypothetical protein